MAGSASTPDSDGKCVEREGGGGGEERAAEDGNADGVFSRRRRRGRRPQKWSLQVRKRTAAVATGVGLLDCWGWRWASSLWRRRVARRAAVEQVLVCVGGLWTRRASEVLREVVGMAG